MIVTNRKEPFIAKEDIPCWVERKRIGALSGGVTIEKQIHHYWVSGIPFAFTAPDTPYASYDLVPAVIPGGSEYWISEDLFMICSEGMKILDHGPTREADYEFLKEIPRLEATDEGVKLRGGQTLIVDWLGCLGPDYLSVRPLLSLEECDWKTLKQARADMNGRANTEYLAKKYPLPYIPGVKYCLELDGYLPAYGELTEAFKDLFEINLTLMFDHDVQPIIVTHNPHVSSTIRNAGGSWNVFPGEHDFGTDSHHYEVIAFK